MLKKVFFLMLVIFSLSCANLLKPTKPLTQQQKYIIQELQKFKNMMIHKDYYESGYLKRKISSLNIPKESLNGTWNFIKIVTEYYDNENADIAKSSIYIFDLLFLDRIYTDDGKYKCDTSFVDFDDIEEVFGLLINTNTKDLQFKEVNYDNALYIRLALPVIASNADMRERKVTCNYSDVNFSFYFKTKNLKNKSFVKSSGKINANNMEQAENIIKKYYHKDISVKNKMKSFISEVKELF